MRVDVIKITNTSAHTWKTASFAREELDSVIDNVLVKNFIKSSNNYKV